MQMLYTLLAALFFFMAPPTGYNGFFQANYDYWNQGGGFTTFFMVPFFTSLILVLLFYYVLNGRSFSAKFYHKSTWFSWMGITAVLTTIFTLMLFYKFIPEEFKDKPLLGLEPWGGTCWTMIFSNLILSCILFFGFSYAFKWWSTNGQRTPF